MDPVSEPASDLPATTPASGPPEPPRPRGAAGSSAPTHLVTTAQATAARPPEQIGSYRVLEQLGEGGMGAVYLAEQREPVRRRVALKLVKPGMDTREVLARFEAERQVLALLNHPNVAAVYDAGMTELGRPYFAMEYVPGQPITKYSERTQLEPRARIELFIQVCEAVQHAHQKGVIHRDLKPSNILVAERDGQATPKVIDFGVAKAFDQRLVEHTLYTQQGQMIGTPEYMSPEQADPSGRDIDTRTDVYALGVVLYELLTGVLPLEQELLRRASLVEMQRIIREYRPPRPSTRISSGAGDPGTTVQGTARLRGLRRALRGDLDWITMKAMEKDRERRYASASELAADLRRHLVGEPVIAGPPSLQYRLGKFIRRYRGAVSAAAALVLSLAGGFGLSTYLYVQADAARRAEGQALRMAELRRVQAEQAKAQVEAERDRVVQAERAAKAAADRATAINAFIIRALGEADLRKQGRNVTVVDALARASDAIVALSGQPETQAEVHHQLGQTYHSLGLPEEALAHMLRAHELIIQLGGPANPAYSDVLGDLGLVHLRSGRLDEALALYREALQAARRKTDETHPNVLKLKLALALALGELHQWIEAEPLLRETLAARRAQDPEGREVVIALNSLAWCVHKQGRLAEAGPLYREALDLSRRVLGREDLDTLIVLQNFANLLREGGQAAEAEPLAREAAERFRMVNGPEHPSTALAVTTLSRVLTDLRRYDEAGALAQEALRIERATGGPNLLDRLNMLVQIHRERAEPRIALPFAREAYELAQAHPRDDAEAAIATSNLAWMLSSTEGLDASEPLFREALERSRLAHGTDHRETLACLNSFAVALHRHGRLADATTLYEESLGIGQRVLSPDHVDVLITRHNIAHLLASRGLLAQAEAQARQAVADFERVLGPDHPHTATVRRGLADICSQRGRWDEAVAILRDVLTRRTRTLGERHRSTMAAQTELADALLEAGQIDEAVTMARATLAARQAALPPGDRDLATGQVVLGKALTAAGELDEAERLLHAALELRRGLSPAAPVSVALAESALGACLVRQERLDLAEPLLVGAANVLAEQATTEPARLRQALQRVVAYYELRGNADAAAEWRVRLAAAAPAEP